MSKPGDILWLPEGTQVTQLQSSLTYALVDAWVSRLQREIEILTDSVGSGELDGLRDLERQISEVKEYLRFPPMVFRPPANNNEGDNNG